MEKVVKEAEERKRRMKQEREEKSKFTKTTNPNPPKPKPKDDFQPIWERNACQPRYKPSNRMKKG